MKITFLGHCGFAVDTGPHVLLFDYSPRAKKAQADAILAGLLRGRRPLVFVSHVHGDHFSPDIYDLPAAQYLIAADVPAQKGAFVVQCGQQYTFPVYTLQTFRSTDEGVAFLIGIDGFRIYHAGDLNWWHWPEEPDPWNPNMKTAFLQEAKKVAREPIDLAFLTADPRQREAWLWGFDYLMRNGQISRAVPMHFWNLATAPGHVLEADCTAPYRNRIVPLSRLGQAVTLEKEDLQ